MLIRKTALFQPANASDYCPPPFFIFPNELKEHVVAVSDDQTAATGKKRAELEKKKEAARVQDAIACCCKLLLVTSRRILLDRLAKEMKAQREWSDRWGALNDPKLYLGEDGPDAYPLKAPPTKWSAYSIINTPKRNPLSSRPTSAEDYDNSAKFNNFKVTGARHDYLSQNNARHPNHPTPVSGGNVKGKKPNGFRNTDVETSSYDREFGGKFEFDYKTGHSQQPNNGIPSKISTKSHSLSSLFTGSESTTARNANGIKQPTPEPSFVVTNGTPQYSNNSNEAVYPDGTRVRLKGIPTDLPAAKYAFPPTTNMEYGWTKNGRKATLEIFGSTSADFAKESWKRANQKNL
ncbi:hypothetical protein BDR26DRAFT_854606 [Obelidium mucronatum]|nr:hypothetical protein BDR26DRAFT_854606 [Obelidium mucronatum]